MKATHELLNLEQKVYEDDIFERYMRWCENIANKKNIEIQILLANTAIANYYRYQFYELEHEFKISAQLIFGKVSHEIIRTMYAQIMCQLYANYPSALIDEAKKMKIENPPYAN